MTIFSKLNATGGIPKQRFVENFSGDSLDTDRWNTTNTQGSGTFTTDDNIDGGFKITTSSTNNDRSSINFNNKRNFNHIGSVSVSVCKAVDSSSRNVRVGLSNGTDGFSSHHAVIGNDTNNTNYELNTEDASTESGTEGSVAIDQSFHVHKITLSSSNAVSSIDGVTDVTKTTNLPADKLQPLFQVHSRTGAKQGNIRYMEVYNT